MSFTDEFYSYSKKKKKDEKKVSTSSTKTTSSVDSFTDEFYSLAGTPSNDTDDIAPLYVNKTAPLYGGGTVGILPSVKDDEDDGWFTSGAYRDGYQLGDVTKQILGTINDISENVTTAVFDATENLIDTSAYGVGMIGGMFSKDFQEDVGDFIAKDLLKSEQTGKAVNKYLNPAGMLTDLVTGGDTDKYSVLGEKSEGLVQSAAHLVGTAALQYVGVPWWLPTGVNSFGSTIESTLQDDATFAEAGVQGAISTGVEILTEKLFGGSGLGEKGLINLDGLTKGISSKAVKALADFGVDMTAEGFEEVAADFFTRLGSSLYKEESLDEILASEEALESYLDSFIGGFALGGGMNVGKVTNSIKTGRDYRTGLTADEQEVYNRLYKDLASEIDGALTKAQQEDIHKQVQRMMDRGYISTDTIEEVLGGETYKAHQETIKNEEALKNEFKMLNGMKQMEMTGEQIDRRNELKEQLAEIDNNFNRNQLRDEVLGRIQGSRLMESYRESDRRYTAYQADLTKYSKKQQATIQRAIDSGILNNTNRTHEMVDMLAKIEADKGVPFDFTNNEKLKDSAYAIDGKVVNGFVTDSGVTLNIQSAKALNSVVGHEITHVFEGTEHYNILAKAVKQYATTKGEYQSRYDAVSKLYKDVKDANVEKELTADLIGDYLFNDTDFVNHLSVTNRNVFQRLWDEIKYLCKVATAGSKEARQLEMVKKAFEDAYRNSVGKKFDAEKTDTSVSENTDVSGDAQYSLGYHAGDLGKAEGYWNMVSSNRGTGHFGTGTYFVGDEAQINDGEYGKRPHESVDFDNYHLFKPLYEGEGFNLHDSLKYINDNISLYPIASMSFEEAYDIRKSAENAEYTLYWEDSATEAEKADAQKILDSLKERFESIGYDPDSWDSERLYEEITSIRQDYRDAKIKLAMIFRDGDIDSSKTKVDSIMNRVYDEVSKIKDSYAARYEDSPSTRFMKALGYEGVDVRGFKGLDNTTYGSVIYDLKGDDAKRKADIGTARYSVSDSDGRQLTTEQQEYFKDSKVRDENGYLLKMYHGTPNGNYTVFRDGTYFTADKEYADRYQSPSASSISTGKVATNPKTFEVYLDIKKPFDIADAEARNIYINEYIKGGNALGINPYLSDAEYSKIKTIDWTEGEDLRDFLIENGYDYDGLVLDEGGDGGYGENVSYRGKSYVVFSPEQVKNIDNLNPTSDPDIRYSLSEEAAPIRRDHSGIYGEDIALAEAPVQEAVPDVVDAENATTMFPDDVAPMPEDEETARDRLASLTDADAPAEMEAPYSESGDALVDNPFEDRDWWGVGNRKVKAYMYENPEVKPFFQEEAGNLLGELQDTVKGEKWYNAQMDYDYGVEAAWGGVKRFTSESMEILLDQWNMSYADIEKGLNAIIEDNGAENIAAAKKIEFMLNDRLMNGYKNFYGRGKIPPNEAYLNMLHEKQVTEYSKEAFDRFMENADQYAPVEEFAPTIESHAEEAYEAITPKQEKQPRMARATPEEQARAEILVDEPKTEKKKTGVMSKIRNLVLDKGMVFENLSLKTGNRELQARWDSIRRAESKAQRFMENGNAMSSSLKSIQNAVAETGKTKSFYEYLYHMHNVDRMTLENRYEDTENKPVFGYGVTAEMSQDAAAKLEKANPEFKQFAQDVYNYMGYLRDVLVDGGVISSETANLWKEMYPHYVPIRRLGDEGLNINVPLDTGRTGVNAPVKRATGGNRDILPLFDTMGQRTLQTFKAVAKNRFGVELKNTLGTTIDSEAMGVDEVIDSIDTHDGLLQEGKNGRSPTFTVFENGEKVTFEITDEMYDAMKPTSDALAYTNKALNTITNVRRGVITEYNPWFLLKNVVKDTQDVLINSQHPAKTYAAIPKAIKQMSTNGHWYQEYLDNGGEQNTYFDKETNTVVEQNKTMELLKKVTGLDFIAKANNVIERMPRLAEYIASRESGRSVDVSMLDAARVTTNFAAGGDLTKFLNRNGATFLNASVQGAMQNVRNIREAKMNGLKGWASLAGKFVAAGLPAVILNNFIWDDDEEYDELSDYVKQNYYIVGKYGDGKFVRIPKGRTVAVIQNAVEQISNAVTGDDEVDLNSFVELVISNLAPNNPIDNNILSPIIQVANNETWYGDDLVPTRLQDLPAAEQYDESTDSISRWLGETFNVSPYKVNYLIDQYSGVLGDTFLPMLTPEAESGDDSFLGNMIAPLKDMFTTDSVMKNQSISDFYSLKDELTVNANASGATDDDVLMNKYMNSVNAELAELYAEKRKIQNSDLPDAEKYAAVRDIQNQIVEMAKEGMATYSDISYEDDYREGGEYAWVNDRLYKLNDEGEWQKLSDEQVTKYTVTKAAGDASYATDGTNHYRWYVSEDGEAGWRKVTDKELERQGEVTRGLGITPEQYWNNREEYSFAYDSPDRYAVAKSVGGYEAYRSYMSELYDIKADKDENGKSITGSRKEKVLNYINNLDADYYTKILLWKSEYTSDDTYNYEIIDYLNGREDISYEEMVSILRELGFTVTADGYVTW